MNKELTFDDEEDVYSAEDLNDDSEVLDILMDSKISESRFAEIIDEFEVSNDFYENDETDDISSLDSFDPLDLH